LLAAWENISSVHAIHIDTLLARGDSSLAITWTPDSNNTNPEWYRKNGSDCTGSDTVYLHCDFTPGITYSSIAYSYGGEDSFLRFREKVENGFLVGSHLCHYNSFGDPSPAVAGTDCSGFVCYLWDVPRVSTRGLYSDYISVSRSELSVGDILVKPGSHTLLIVEVTDSTQLLIWESTSVVNGCRERIIDLNDTYWDTYYPRRNKDIVTGIREPLPATAYPIEFPSAQVHRGTLVLSAQKPWTGTAALYTGCGRLLSENRINGKMHTTLSTRIERPGVYILRYFSRSGAEHSSTFAALCR
jgi:hypothetical protein